MRSVLSRHIRLFLRCWFPGDGTLQGRYSLQRLVVLAFFWPLFVAVQLINWGGLLLDEVLFSAYRRVRIIEPVFVLGMPRSGTTFLHRLLAGDRGRFTTMTLWEVLFAPSITQRFFWYGVAAADRRVGRPLGRLLHLVERLVLGGLDDVHRTGLLEPEEDYLALTPVLGCFLLVVPFPDPAMWRLAYFDRDGLPEERDRLMAFYRRLVQRHLYFHGTGKTFLSKNPSFTPLLNGLMAAFGDARFVACFRDPVEAVPSQINSIIIGARIFDGRVDEAYWREGLLAMLRYYGRHLLDTLPQLPAARQVSVTLDTLSADPQSVVTALYHRLGWHMSGNYRFYLRGQSKKARGYRSGHEYSLAGVGLSAERLHREFDFLYRHFGFSAAGDVNPLRRETSVADIRHVSGIQR